jgi:tRNA G18 (ribose-2'-O)-methylase SpoU
MASVAHGGDDPFDASLSPPVAIAIGNEGAGLTAGAVDACDRRITIPLAPGSESLNAAAAAAVMLFHAVRHRTKRQGPG